jgi:hypothetical protein
MPSTRKSKSSSARSSSRSRSRAGAKPINGDELIRALTQIGVSEENARLIVGLTLGVVGTYDPNTKVAGAARDAAEEVADEIEHAPHTKKVEEAIREAANQAEAGAPPQAGGAWDTQHLWGFYTTATATMGAISFASVQATKRILLAAGCDSRIINIVCFMIPCLLHGLPELIAPGAIPGLAYVPPAKAKSD